jgi:hypothetical protein
MAIAKHRQRRRKAKRQVRLFYNTEHAYVREFTTTSSEHQLELTPSDSNDAHVVTETQQSLPPISMQDVQPSSLMRTPEKMLRVQLAAERLKTRRQAQQLATLRRRLDTVTSRMQKIFSADQVEHLNGNKTYPWSADTIKHALQMRAVMGKHGYEFMRKSAGYPVPSYRTLCERMENMPMAPGIQHDLMELLQSRLQSMGEHDRDCVLLLDEVQLKVKAEYDNGLKRLVGFVSPELQSPGKENEFAEHALVYMVKGLRKPYKQVVAWYLTGKGTTGSKLWQLTKGVIEELHKHLVRIRVVTSDMGTSNQGMWRCAGVQFDDPIADCFIRHPCDEAMKLYFMADVPHLLKSLRNCLEKQTILLPDDIAVKYDLATNAVSMEHVLCVVSIQEFFELKLVPGLSRSNVYPGQYTKMKVSNSTKIFSHTMASVLQDLIQSGIMPAEAEAMAWFCDELNTWFDIMSNRKYSWALFDCSQSNIESPSLSHRNIMKLQEVVQLMSQLNVVSPQGRTATAWKPWQKGFILSTRVVLSLYDDLVSSGRYSFLVTARMTQDALENLFSQIRGCGDDHPSVFRFRQYLKLVTISQLMDVPKNNSYDTDSLPNLVDFIKSKQQAVKHEPDDEDFRDLPELPQLDAHVPSAIEEKSLYNLAGWVGKKLMSFVDGCPTCMPVLHCDKPTLPQASLVIVKSFGYLNHPSPQLFYAIQEAEQFFRCHDISNSSVDLVVQSLAAVRKQQLPPCEQHTQLYMMAMQKFIGLRMHIRGRFLTEHQNLQAQYASKSAAARTTIL